MDVCSKDFTVIVTSSSKMQVAWSQTWGKTEDNKAANVLCYANWGISIHAGAVSVSRVCTVQPLFIKLKPTAPSTMGPKPNLQFENKEERSRNTRTMHQRKLNPWYQKHYKQLAIIGKKSDKWHVPCSGHFMTLAWSRSEIKARKSPACPTCSWQLPANLTNKQHWRTRNGEISFPKIPVRSNSIQTIQC